MILVDSNVPMYLVGAEHPHKNEARRLLEEAVSRHEVLVTDAEVLQEILHRYSALKRPDAIPVAFEALLGVVEEVFPVERRDVERARDILLGSKRLSSRDALHIAVMERHGVPTILSFDAGFDGYPGLTRRPGPGR
ncbi:MAG TPA: type II toxin-antitoxin system VapC family toxin [Planctomycetota bacterium]|nr:type II toxin-antitoxin system VapC family toxin [Planctomycetota bacterium]